MFSDGGGGDGVTPPVNRKVLFGLRFESTGQLIVDGDAGVSVVLPGDAIFN